MSSYPDFYIVGAPKCGTTALYEYLRQHPQVFMPFHKEPLFFGSDLTRRYGALTEEQYLALFRDARDGQLTGEASAWYLYSATSAEEIHAVRPDARIIVMLRNPVDVMYAQHSQLLYNRQEDIADFGEALAAEEDRVQGSRLPPGPLRPENLFYRRMVRFADQLERYRRVFGPERVHVIVHDDMRRDTPGEYRRVLEFLGVDPGFVADFTPANENKRVRFAWLQRLIWNPPFARRIVPVLRRFPLVHGLRARILAMNSERAARQAMDPALRARLTGEMAGEVARLGELIGRDLGHWSRLGDALSS